MFSFIRKYQGLNKFIILVVDVLLLHISFILAYIIKFGLHPPKENLLPYYMIFPVITIAFIILLNIYGLYTISMKSIGSIIFSLIIALVILNLITMSSTFLIRRFAFPRSVLIMSFIIQVILLSFWRYFVQVTYKKAHGEKNIMIIGDGVTGELLAKKLITTSKGWYNIRFIIEPNSYIELFKYLDQIDAVHICDNVDENVKTEIIKAALEQKKEVYLLPELRDILLVKSEIVQFDDIPAISINYPELTIEQKFIKRVFDVILAFIGIIAASPVMLIAAILIRITSRGGAIYKQIRITENNKEFELYKFRTMFINAEGVTGPVFASEDDPRITKVGKFLRAVRIDELPQLYNVLKGEMSFIGPRPERPYFVKQFEASEPAYKYRHNVKSGITGLAQVMGKYTTDVRDKLRLDLIYIKNYSFLLDIKILLLTIKIALSKEASSGVKESKNFKEILNSMDYNAYSEAGVTKVIK